MRWTPDAIAAATGGTVSGDRRVLLGGVCIDSRVLRAGEVFVAIRGDRDGHEFTASAIAAGAGAVLIERGREAVVAPPVPAVVVRDTRVALLDLGRAARDRVPGPVIGITGSVGKTTTKDMVAAAVSSQRRTVASEKSFNNELGVPLTLANAPENTEVAVIEMGARGPGHISKLCDVARPTVGVVIAVAAAHTEMFGGLDGVAAAKSELVRALPPTGTAVLNADDDRVAAMSSETAARVLTYSVAKAGCPSAADVSAHDVTVDSELRPTFRVSTPWGGVEVRLRARGIHQIGNALAALAVACTCGVELEAAAAALAHAPVSQWRMDLQRTPTGATILNDAYNANPASMHAALRALASLSAARKRAVLGVMAELGRDSEVEHLAVADLAKHLGIEVIAVGTGAYGPDPLPDVASAEAALGALGPDDAVLVKGSRVAGLERLAERLVAKQSRR